MTALLHALRRRLPVALSLGTVLASAVAFLVWLFVPVKSEVEAWFMLKSAPPVLVENVASTALRGSDEFDFFRRTQTQIIKTPIVLTKALSVPGIVDLSMIKGQRDPVQFLRDQLTVDFPGESELMRISMSGESPDQLVQLVEAVSKAYISEVVERDKQVKSENYDTLVTTGEALRQQIQHENNNYKRLSETLGTINQDVIALEQTLALQQVSSSSNLMSDLSMRNMEAQTRLELLRQQQIELEKKGTPEWAVDQELNKDPNFMQLQAALQEQQDQLRNAKLHMKVDGPRGVPARILRLENSVADLIAERDAYRAEKASAAAEAIEGDTVESIAAEIQGIETQMGFFDSRIAEEKGKLDQANSRLKKLSSSSPELMALVRKIEQYEFSYRKVASEIRAIEVELKAPARVFLMQKALPPESDSSALRTVMVGFSWVFVFGLAAFGFAFWEMQAGRVNDKADVADKLGLRVVGGLPGLGGRLSRRGANDDLIEAVDGLRTLLMHHASLHGTRVVQITSAGAHEGKTTLATQLAASLARAGRRTLFLDGDVRNPTAHLLFEMPLDPGFCDLLRGQVDADDVVQPTRIPGLWMIPAGRCDIECIHELAKEGVATLFERLRRDFDFVILDSGPVLAVTDALLLGKLADTTILSVLRDVSRASQVQEAHHSLERVGVHVLGSVVQGVANEQATRRHKLPLQLASST